MCVGGGWCDSVKNGCGIVLAYVVDAWVPRGGWWRWLDGWIRGM